MDLAAGLRFRPTDEEIITYWCRNSNTQLSGSPYCDLICEVDFYAHNPQELIAMHKLKDHQELYFKRPRNGNVSIRPSRSAKDGFWRTTAKSKPLYHMGSLVGYKRALDYHTNGKRTRTDYKVHEYTCERTTSNLDQQSGDWVINKLYKNRGGLLYDSESPCFAKKAKQNNDGDQTNELVDYECQPDDHQESRPPNQENLSGFHLDQIPQFDIDEGLFTGFPACNANQSPENHINAVLPSAPSIEIPQFDMDWDLFIGLPACNANQSPENHINVGLPAAATIGIPYDDDDWLLEELLKEEPPTWNASQSPENHINVDLPPVASIEIPDDDDDWLLEELLREEPPAAMVGRNDIWLPSE